MPFSLQDLLTQMDQTDLSSSPSDDLKEQLKAQLRSSFGIPDDEDEKPKKRRLLGWFRRLRSKTKPAKAPAKSTAQ